MSVFLAFTMTGDPVFDFFFSITASFGLLFYLSSEVIKQLKDHY